MNYKLLKGEERKAFVDNCRREGKTYQQIGELLGVSRQQACAIGSRKSRAEREKEPTRKKKYLQNIKS